MEGTDVNRATRYVGAALALAVFIVYAWLCPPVSGMGDSSEFTLVLATGGAAHPTGYPLYTMFGHYFCTILHSAGIGWALAASLWSVLGAVIALGLLGALATQLVDRIPAAGMRSRLLAPLVPLVLFAFQPVLLSEATRAEVNVWSLAWACGAALVFLTLADPIGEPGTGGVRDERVAAALWGLVCGLGLAHHLTSVLISLPLTAALIAIFARRGRLPASVAGLAIIAALVPLSSYGLIAWRAWHPAPGQWSLLEPTLASVIAHVTGSNYRHFLGRFAPSIWEAERLRTVVFPFLLPGLAFLMLGVRRARETDRRIVWVALLSAALLASVFPFFYGIPDPAPYFLPAMALGVAAAAPAIAALPGAGTRSWSAAVIATALACVLAVVPWVRDGVEERQATIGFDKLIRSMWSSIPPDTAIVSWTDDRFNRLVEYQVLLGEKPALLIVTPDMIPSGPVRRTFQTRFGIDPMEGFEPVQVTTPLVPGTAEAKRTMDEARRRLLRGISDRIRAPVILFDPAVPIVWQFRKPWEPRDGRPDRPVEWVHPPFDPNARR